MRWLGIVGAAMVMGAAVQPAYAVFCTGASEGLNLGFSLQLGGKFTSEDRDRIDLAELRRRGVDASSVERWNGCIRAYVYKPEGGQEMWFFEPGTYRRVD